MPIVSELGEHEGKPIRRTSLEVRNIAGGLHKATKTDPFILNPGERAFIVAEVIGGPHTFKPLDDGSGSDSFDAWERVNVSNADTVVIVDEELVAEMIEKQREKNRLLAIAEQEEKDAAKGKLSLELGDKANAGVPVDPIEAHNRGEHKRKRKDCPECQAEVTEAKRIADEQSVKPKRRGRSRAGLKSV